MKHNHILSSIRSSLQRRTLCTALAVTLLQVVPLTARADLLLDFTGGNANTFGGAATVGWEFTLATPVQLDGLGFWDHNSNGLINSHDVGIWNSASPSTLLVSTVITSASTPVSSTSSSGRWLFNSVPSMTLSPGTYVVGATIVASDPDLQRFSATASMYAGATFVQARNIGTATLTYPTPAAVFNDGVFGPNLQVSAVPEPSTVVILLCGLTLWVRARVHEEQAKA